MTRKLRAGTEALVVDRETPAASLIARKRRIRKSFLAEIGRQLAAEFSGILRWLQRARRAQLAAKRLRVCETVSLGDKRAIFLVQVDGRRFLLGGAANSVSLLTPLDGVKGFPKVRKKKLEPQQAEA